MSTDTRCVASYCDMYPACDCKPGWCDEHGVHRKTCRCSDIARLTAEAARMQKAYDALVVDSRGYLVEAAAAKKVNEWWRVLLLSITRNMVLSDHIGDAWSGIGEALKLAGLGDIPTSGDDFPDLKALDEMGARGFWGADKMPPMPTGAPDPSVPERVVEGEGPVNREEACAKLDDIAGVTIDAFTPNIEQEPEFVPEDPA